MNIPEIHDLRLNHMVNPLGYTMEHTVFSWKADFAISESRVVVKLAKDGKTVVKDTGFAKLDNIACDIALDLMPRTRYTWSVECHGTRGEMAASDSAWFETGRMDESFTGKWITDGSKWEKMNVGTGRAPIFTKHVALPQIDARREVAQARMYICGLGVYVAEINGERVGTEHMAPYINDYDTWVQYQTYDVTDMLKNGGDVAVTVLHGWYGRGGYGFDTLRKGKVLRYGDEVKLICDIVLTYTDGTEEVIGTDDTWQMVRSNITFSNIYDGEMRDDTLEAAEPVNAILTSAPRAADGFLKTVSPCEARLMARLSTPVTVHEVFPVKELIIDRNGDTVLDIGQEITGVFRLHVREEKGTKIHLQAGEIMQDGCFYRKNLRKAKAEYWYTSDGVEKDIEPEGTFYGYRYIKIEGAKNFRAEDFTAETLYSEIPQTGFLSTGNDKVNKIISNSMWGQVDNFLDTPTDCPQRDERMGWTGDAEVFAPTACLFRDCLPFYRKFMYDMRCEQAKFGGIVPYVIPLVYFEYKSWSDVTTYTCAAWGDAACVIPWAVYMAYGDKSFLQECFPQMKAWVDAVKKMEDENHGWRDHGHCGDWLALDGIEPGDSAEGSTDKGLIAETYYYYSASIVANSAIELGIAADAVKYQRIADEVKEYIHREYFTVTGRLAVNTQTACLLMLHHNLTPDRNQTVKQLRALFDATRGNLRTGFVGTPILMQTLTEAGMYDVCVKMLLNEDYPGWIYEINHGATTIWERWNSVDASGHLSSNGMNSLNHYSYGSVCAWLWEDVLGIKPAVPGYKKAILCPRPIR